uniref:DSBA-like thioredoxin domain-containing protein n=1 Tax=Haptolina brevifila TaxID=156173 RepID=A0A7S2CX16_9EUKA|mmetsp:Transcript_29587/g.59504  ORF Transcript_29587/g.59504 Transcript_29587/m.59504 type:complete len:417 (+) Transcript_29587:521-1771(+)
MAGMKEAGKPLGIDFDYNCYINRQPIDSQRMLLYAARHGKQEEYMTCLNKRHFTQGSDGESASKRHTVLAAAKEAGLDPQEAEAFYDSGELRDVVWKSYGEMPKRGINAIPLFVFNVPEIGVEGGPLRPHATGSQPPIVNGSMTIELFENLFDDLWDQVAKFRKKSRLLPPPTQLPPPEPPTSKPLNTKPSKPAAAHAPPPPSNAPPPSSTYPSTTSSITPSTTPSTTPSITPSTTPASSTSGVNNLLAEIARRGGDLPALLNLSIADERSTALHAALKQLGYSKLGDRMRAASALAEEARRTGDGKGTRDGKGIGGNAAPKAATAGGMGPLSGKRVVLLSLSTKPELNGKVGIAGRLDAAKGRYGVRLVDSNESLSVKAANLREDMEAEVSMAQNGGESSAKAEEEDEDLAFWGF